MPGYKIRTGHGYIDQGPPRGQLERVWVWDGTLNGFDSAVDGADINTSAWTIDTTLIGEPVVHGNVNVAVATVGDRASTISTLPFNFPLPLNCVIKCRVVRDASGSTANRHGMGLWWRGDTGSEDTTGYLAGSYKTGSSTQGCFALGAPEVEMTEQVLIQFAHQDEGYALEVGARGSHIQCAYKNFGSGFNIDANHTGTAGGLTVGLSTFTGTVIAGFYSIEIFRYTV